ncbi:protein MIS12 homolog [Actinia tenebrosa]|uniref:Protein MIS12 homolog n=1 Tax=Actinia tenebrosa TaxID=6105 RepID=A0A6P8IN85_ACTTE|nr:protein MIS12 homolog [Actinia tenebrosa]
MAYNREEDKNYEYETQFFGFTPKSFVDGVYNAINDYVSDCFKELEKLLSNEPTLTKDCTAEQIHQKTDQMLSKFYESMDVSFDRLEIFLMQNIFKIPPNVLLPEDKIHESHNHTKDEEVKMDDEIQELLRKLKAAKYVNKALKQEQKELESAETQVAECGKYLDLLEKTCQTGLGLKECLVFTCDQANKLHDQLSMALEGGVLPVQEPKGEKAKIARKKLKIG